MLIWHVPRRSRGVAPRCPPLIFLVARLCERSGPQGSRCGLRLAGAAGLLLASVSRRVLRLRRRLTWLPRCPRRTRRRTKALRPVSAHRVLGPGVCFRCRKIAYRGGIGADKDWWDACGYGSCGSGDAWVAKARRCAPEGMSSKSTQVPPHWQGGIPSRGEVASAEGAHLLQGAVPARMLPRHRPHNLVVGRPAPGWWHPRRGRRGGRRLWLRLRPLTRKRGTPKGSSPHPGSLVGAGVAEVPDHIVIDGPGHRAPQYVTAKANFFFLKVSSAFFCSSGEWVCHLSGCHLRHLRRYAFSTSVGVVSRLTPKMS